MVAGALAKDLFGSRGELFPVDESLFDQKLGHAVEPPPVEGRSAVVLRRHFLHGAAVFIEIEGALGPQHVEHPQHVLFPEKRGPPLPPAFPPPHTPPTSAHSPPPPALPL